MEHSRFPRSYEMDIGYSKLAPKLPMIIIKQTHMS